MGFKFYRFAESAPLPVAGGPVQEILSARAFRYCHPARVASCIGWLMYPPMDFALRWDRDQVFWSYGTFENWLLLDRAQLPNMHRRFADLAPEPLRELSPPFLTVFPEPGVVQIWLGYSLRSPSGWSAQVRTPVNHRRNVNYELIEGIIETDWWCGPLVTVVQINTPDVPIMFSTKKPLVQVVPIERTLYEADSSDGKAHVINPFENGADFDWDRFRNSVRRTDESSAPGDYMRARRHAAKGV